MADRRSVVFPGFVDLQVNGMHGIDFSAEDLSEADCLLAFGLIRGAGTAAFLPTVITSPVDRCLHNLAAIARAAAAYEHSEAVAGIHLEGPFLDPTPGAIGAHNPAWVLAPDPALFDRFQAAAGGMIRVLTVAAGVDGVERLIAHAQSSGVVVALGHQMAGYAAMRRAADAGASLLTHLGNGIPHELNRHENPLLAGLAEDRLAASFIADGHHLPPELVRLVLKVKGVERAIAVSDASPVAGLPAGEYTTLGTTVEVTSEGLVVLPGTRYLAGSGSNLLQCMNRLASWGVLADEALLAVGVSNPASLVGIRADDLEGPGVRYDPQVRRFEVVVRE